MKPTVTPLHPLFGSLDSPRLRIGGLKRRIEHKEIFDISNLDENGGILSMGN
jgi:hypothetical protein